MRRRERRLRETVEQRQGCLDELPAREERVLRLRAGVGPAQPLSRTRVARRLDLTVRRVARLERAGLRRLRGLCAPALASAPVAQPGTRAVFTGSGADGVGGGEFGSAAGGAPVRGSAGTDDGGGNSAGRGSTGSGVPEDEGDGATGSGSGDRGGVAGATQTHLPGSGDEGFNLLVPLILLLMALAAWAVVAVLRRRDESAPVAPPPPGPWRPRVPPSSMTGPGWTERPTSRGESGRWSAPPAPEQSPEPTAPEPPAGSAPDESWTTPRRSPTRR